LGDIALALSWQALSDKIPGPNEQVSIKEFHDVLSLATEQGGGQIITDGRIAGSLPPIPNDTYPPPIRPSLVEHTLDIDYSWKEPTETDQMKNLLLCWVTVQPKKTVDVPMSMCNLTSDRITGFFEFPVSTERDGYLIKRANGRP
jgi:hypothetical protein